MIMSGKECDSLCAEDNEPNAEILMELLKIEGAECTEPLPVK